jgi:hypothetical protein
MLKCRIIGIATLMVITAGCQTPATLTASEIDSIPFDCRNRDGNIAMMENSRPSVWEQLQNAFTVTSSSGFVRSVSDGTYSSRRQHMDGTTEAIRRVKIDQYRSNCAR